MSLYRCEVKTVSRGKGHSAVAKAAYNTRSILEDKRLGVTHDYSTRAHTEEDLLFAGFYAPKDAPEWAKERGTFWNAVEEYENRKDSRLARNFDIALPHELTPEQSRYALQDWIKENFTRKGYVADVGIHAASVHGDERNTHAHVLVSSRQLEQGDFADKKDTSQDTDVQCNAWRESWAKHLSHHLERHGFALEAERMATGHLTKDKQLVVAMERGDHDYAEQMEAIPGIHIGKAAYEIARKGGQSDRMDAQAEIERQNREAKAERAQQRKAEREAAKERANAPAQFTKERGKGAYEALQTSHREAAPEILADKAMERQALADAWKRADGDALAFVCEAGDRDFWISEHQRRDRDGKLTATSYFAIDGRGMWHQLNAETLGQDGDKAQERLQAAFGVDAETHLLSTSEVKEMQRAERKAERQRRRDEGLKQEPAPDRRDPYFSLRVEHNAKRNDYLVTQRERLADSETVQQINLAWHHRNDSNFGHELDRRGFIVARVTDDEAKASKAARDEAKAEREKQVAALTAANATERAAKVEAKGLPRQWEAGQLVAVNSFGHAYALDLFTVQGEIAEVNSTLQTMTGDYASMSLAKEGQKVRYEKQIESQRQEAAQRLAGRDDVKTLREHWQAKNTTSDGVQQFFENIKEAGFTVACVDAKEAKHSQINAEIARNYSPDYFIPTYDAGEMIAFAASGASYRLNGITLDDKHAGNQLTDYLATQPAMMNLTEARETIRENREAERAEPQIQIAPIVGDALGAGNLGAKVTVKGLESIGNAVDSVVDGIAGFLFGGLGHTSSPAIHYEQNATAARTIPAAPEAQPSQARQVREEGKRAEKGGGDSRGASWEAFKESHLQQFDPEIIEAMRRRREEQERQEREDRSRERGRER